MRALNELVVRLENLKKYKVIKRIGEGGQAKVYLVKRQENH
jgi:hypothetical protein